MSNANGLSSVSVAVYTLIILIHRPVNALQAERRDNFGNAVKTLIEDLLFVVRPTAQDEVNLCAACELVADTEAYTAVVGCTEYLLDMFEPVVPAVATLLADADRAEG